MNLLDDFNFEFVNPINVSSRRCSHCRKIGHTLPTCRQAISLGHNLHLHAINIRNAHRRPDGVFDEFVENDLLIYLSNLSIIQLKLIMNSDKNDFRRFTNRLLTRGVITINESLMNYKDDRLKILMWYYWYYWYEIEKSVNIIKKIELSLELISFDNNFDCPICIENKLSSEIVITNCSHATCINCFGNYICHLSISSNKKPTCSLCRADISLLKLTNNDSIVALTDKNILFKK